MLWKYVTQYVSYLLYTWHCHKHKYTTNAAETYQVPPGCQGLYSLSGKTSYRQISRSLEAARLCIINIVSLLNLTGISAALLPRCLSNLRAIGKVETGIFGLRDFTRSCCKPSYRLVNRGTESYAILERSKFGLVVSYIHGTEAILLTYLKLIPAWISSCIHCNVGWQYLWISKLQGTLVEVWKWINNFIPHFVWMQCLIHIVLNVQTC